MNKIKEKKIINFAAREKMNLVQNTHPWVNNSSQLTALTLAL